ncbi:GGDEF and EAL domain-containing protein [Thermocrispum sp.]|uniref:GGDEF and EAL domain-containing protein n=1 Tax=Thermocrispum sp. TaxID=2060768 RepID=UPI002580D42B|nr:GGDEF and EAL domain-containing protein [Thermocrispum sp.]
MTSPGEQPGSATPSADRFVALFAAAPFGIALTDRQGIIAEANQALGRFLGVDPAELRGKPFVEILTGDGDAAMIRGLIADPDNPPPTGRTVPAVMEHATDGPMHAELTVIALPGDDPKQRYPAVVVRDTSELHLLQEMLRHQNVHDPLTGLPNADSFRGKVEAAMVDRTHPQLALIVFDLDGFRLINDGLGPEVGNRMLSRVADKLREIFPAEAVIGRMIGDRFGVLLRGSFTGQALTRQAEEVLKELAEPLYLDGNGIALSASVGIVVRSTGGSADDLLRAAEITVHRAKSAGRAQWMMFDAEQDRRERHLAKRGAVLGGALETGEFEFRYQPTVRPDGSGELVLIQAELVWNHPDDGVLEAHEFIPMADLTGMTVPIGRWMIDDAVATLARWRAQFGPAVAELAVRLPSRLAIDQDLVGMVRSALDEHQLPAESLSVWTKATTLDDERGDVRESYALLADLGVRVGLLITHPSQFDVFTGDLPLHDVILAESMVELVSADYPVETSATMRGLHDFLAKPFEQGIRVSAQGVESRDQMQRLAELGVSAVRGPAIHQPLTASAMEKLLAEAGDPANVSAGPQHDT